MEVLGKLKESIHHIANIYLQHRMIKCLMNWEVYGRVQLWLSLPRVTDDNHEKYHSVFTMPWARYELGISPMK
jgi:hypothetical protein